MAYILQPSLVEKKSLSPKADFAKNNRKLEFFKNLDSLLDEETCLNSDDLTRSSARHERNDVTKTSHSASLYYGDFDYYRDGRTRSLSRISEASHTSGEHDFWGDPLHPNPPPPQILDFSDFHPATKPTHPEEKCIPEAFINQNFLATPSDKQELTFTAISPPVNPHLTAPTLGDAATPSLTKLAANNSSSCNNLAVVMVPELVTLTFKSESTPELADIAKTNSSKDLHPDAEQKFLQSGNTASLPPSTNDISKLHTRNDTKRSNLKKKIIDPSSLTSFSLDRRPPGSPGAGSKKSISFSNMVHFQVKPAADVDADEDTGSFDVSRSNSEPGPRPLPRDKKLEPADQSKQPTAPAKRKFIVLPTKLSDLRAANTVNESETDAASTENDRAKFSPSQKLEGNIFSRALKNFRGRKPSGESGRQNSEEMEFSSTPPLLGGVRGEVSPTQAAARSDSVNTYNNEDTITSYAESDWAAPVMMRKKKSNHAFHNLSRRGSGTSEDVFTYTKQHDGPSTLPEHLKNSLVVILSGIYGILLVVLGLVLPLSETFIKSQQPYFFEMYYLYLYVVSLIFLIYVYTYLLRRERLSLLSFPKTFSRKLRSLSRSSSQRSSMKGSIDKSGSAPPNPSIAGSTMSRRNSIGSTFSTRSRRRKIGFNSETSNHTGSFYLRIGIIGFGIGSMIHSGLTFGHYFEINHLGDPCSDILQAIKPVAHLCFTFVQMYFVFMNSKMCVHKYKTIARFGMMHMCGTNICVWLRSIVVETLHVIDVDKRSKQQDLPVHMTSTHTPAYRDVNNSWLHQGEGHHTDNTMGMLPELDCHWDAMMGRVVEKSSIYLYPCTIEYSLVCACVLYVMWSNVGEDTTARRLMSLESASDDGTSRESVDDVEERSHRMSVDCAGSSRGLFLGILLFVVCVVCLICYYVLKGSPGNLMAAAVLGHITEDVIYLLAMGATAIAAYKMKSMHFSMAREVGMEEILMLISLSGLGMFGIFSIVSSLFYLDTLDGGLTIITNVLMMVQAASQTTFNLAALRVSATHRSQIREKPGREFVTFLLISNFALWAFNTFETQRSDHNRIQVKFYGATAWAIFSHISVPLGIYFRFHSTVSLSNVWKTAWKLKHAQSGGHLQGH